MQRRKFLRTAGLGAGGVASVSMLSAPAVAQSMPEVKWRLASSFPKSLDTIYGGAEVMAKMVRELTDGKFQIQVFAAGEIVPGLQVLDAVQNGTVEMCHTGRLLLCRQGPDLRGRRRRAFRPQRAPAERLAVQGGGSELFNEFYKEYNIYGLPCGNTGAQMGGWFRKEIKTVADLKGLKMRIGGIAGQVLQQARRRAAADRRRRHLSGAGEGHDRRRRMGRPL